MSNETTSTVMVHVRGVSSEIDMKFPAHRGPSIVLSNKVFLMFDDEASFEEFVELCRDGYLTARTMKEVVGAM